MTTGRLILVKLGILFCTLILSVGLAELGLRLFGYRGEVSFRIQDTVIVDDPVLNWRHKPNSVFYSNDVVYEINKRGFRDRIYPFERSNDRLRIFLASDSVGFGTNVRMSDNYPKLLETRLNELSPDHRSEVINYSMPGLSLRQKLHLVEQYAAAYHPDLIIIDYVLNDVDFESRRIPGRNYDVDCAIKLIGVPIPCAWKSFLKKSALLFTAQATLEHFFQGINWEDRNQFYKQVESDYYHRLYATKEKQDYLRTTFDQIHRYQEQNRVKIIVPIFPLLYDFKQYKWRDLNDLIIELCSRNGLDYVSLLEPYSQFDYNEIRVQRGDFTHPSIKGNEVAAKAIADKVSGLVRGDGQLLRHQSARNKSSSG